MLDRWLLLFIKIWMAVVLLVIALHFAITMASAPTIWLGITAIGDELSPFNLLFYMTLVAFLSPAIIATAWRAYLKRRQREAKP